MLFGKNAWENERIGSHGGGACARHPLDPPMFNFTFNSTFKCFNLSVISALCKKCIVLFSGENKLSQRGMNLFLEVPKERTCSQAAIEPHWYVIFVNSKHIDLSICDSYHVFYFYKGYFPIKMFVITLLVTGVLA